jgi:hypothetical protein
MKICEYLNLKSNLFYGIVKQNFENVIFIDSRLKRKI